MTPSTPTGLLATTLSVAALLSSLPAQVYLPAGLNTNRTELSGFDDAPLMRTNSRVMQIFGRAEVGQSTLTATALSLRYDGPIPPVGASGPFTIRRLRIFMGKTTKPASDTSAIYANNLSSSLTSVFDGRVSYFPDRSFRGPAPWGGPNGNLRFTLSAPITINLAQGERLVLDIRVEGNTNDGRTHALLDGQGGLGGPTDGMAVSSGMGCSASANAPAAVALTSGVHAPGAAHSIHGKNFGANAPAILFIGSSNTSGPVGGLPFSVPGTNCSVYSSWDVQLTTRADATGTIGAFSAGTEIAIPANPFFNGAMLYEQIASVVPGANQPWGVVFSDLREVTLGSINPFGKDMVFLRGSDDADARVADDVREFGLAIRIE